MFGYFRFYSQYSHYATRKVYKNYYCGLCFALEKHYGQLSRMLLSYDVTVLALALQAHPKPGCDKLRCTGQKQCKATFFDTPEWKKLAAVNILLAAEKFRDDIADEGSWKAKLGNILFHGCIRKARADYPELEQAIRGGYLRIMAAEKENLDVLRIGQLFGAMMTDILDAGFSVSATLRQYVHEISRWLYFIDALDDYDEDLKRGRFNPIAQPGISFSTYRLTHIGEISQTLSDLYRHHSALCTGLEDGSRESRILQSILTDSIPAITASVLTGSKLPTLLHRQKGTVWRASP